MNDILDLLKRSHLVGGLSDSCCDAIANLASLERFRPGEQIFAIGDKSSDLLVILSGKVNVLTADDDLLREVGPNGVLGETAFVDGGPCHARFAAVQNSQLARFPARELRSWLSCNREPGFMFLANLSRVLSIRLRQADGRLDELMDLEPEDIWEGVL